MAVEIKTQITKKMKAKLFVVLYLFFGLIQFSNAQTNKYGMLIVTYLDPFQGWNGSHAGNLRISVGSNSVSEGSNTSNQVVVDYNFFYVNDNPTQIVCSSSTAGNKDGSDCKLNKTIIYNPETFDTDYFGGCIGDANIMGIYLKQPVGSTPCKNDLITLTKGWNWQYKYDNGVWADFPATYQAKRTISFKMADLGGYENKKKLYVRTGYGSNFTPEIILDITPCSPSLASEPIPESPYCYNENTGKITMQFGDDIADDEYFLMTLTPMDGSGNELPPYNKTVTKSQFTNRAIIWDNLKAGTYNLSYQTFKTNSATPSSLVEKKGILIIEKTPLSFEVFQADPLCHDQSGLIRIEAKGGTSPYYYIIDSNPEVLFTSSSGNINISGGEHSIKVRDSKSCIDLDKND